MKRGLLITALTLAELLSAAAPGDPGETRNLADDPRYAELVRDMRRKMLDVFMKTRQGAPQLPERLTVEEKLEWFLEPPENAKSQ